MPQTPRGPRPYGDLLKPDLRVRSVLDIELHHLREEGIRGLIFDLDDTLVHALEAEASDAIHAWVQELREEFEVYIVSNNASGPRVDIAAQHLGLPWVHRALKPSRRFFRHALAEMSLAHHQVAIVGDQLFTDVLGGNRLGAMTILVDPISGKDRKWHRKIMRRIERTMLADVAYHVHHPAQSPTGAPHEHPAEPTHGPRHASMPPGSHHRS